MTEWEQMKKEYRDVQIPANGPHQMLEMIEKAKRDRRKSQWKRAARYGAAIAAAILVVLLIPGFMLLSGGFSGSSDETAVEADRNNMAYTGSGQESAKGTYSDAGSAEYSYSVMSPAANQSTAAMDSEAVTEEMGSAGGNSNGSCAYASEPEKAENDTEERRPVSELLLLLSETQKEMLCGEISRQMEERRQQGEEYYTMYDVLTEEVLLEGQSFYMRKDGQIVIEYAPGIIAPEAYGNISFLIPEEIIEREETR